MDKLRVVLSSADGEELDNSHLGDTVTFQIYDIHPQGDWDFVESRENTAREMDHSSKEKMKSVLKIVSDVHLMVSARNSPNFKRIAAKTPFQPVVVSSRNVKQALRILAAHFAELEKLATQKASGQASSEVAILK